MKSLNDLANLFDKMANKIDEKAQKGLEKTAEQVYDDIITNAPVGATGNYVESIRIFPIEKEQDKMSIFIGSDLLVGPTKHNGKFYNLGYLLEHGTLPHDIYPFDKSCLVFTVDNKKIFTKHVWHPGTIAQPHYSLALEKNKEFLKDNIKITWR